MPRSNENPARRANAERGQHAAQETHTTPREASIVGLRPEEGKTHEPTPA